MFQIRAILVFTACLATAAVTVLAAVPAVVARAAATPPGASNWPELMHDSAHTGVSPDQTLSTANASTLGVKWMSAMRSADLGSPVVAVNATLGKTLVYVGDERGDMIGLDAATGTTVWSTSLGYGNFLRSSPMVAQDGTVWIGTAGFTPADVEKLDGATGQILCKTQAPFHLNASFMLATPPGGVPTVYTATNHSTQTSGVSTSLNESNCATVWNFDKWLTLSGAWATPAYGIDANGNGRIFVGSADPDSTEYALDAATGDMVWNYSALNPPDGEFDVGAAATVSAPGNNGFADGVVYFPSKYGVLYALDLTTGSLIWQYGFNKGANVNGGGRSAAALYKTDLVYGMADGVEAVNAVTGTLLWHYKDPSAQEVLSTPAIAGPSGSEIVAFADGTGLVTVLNLSSGAVLYTYQTGNYITASPAIVNGNIIIDSTDGFVYDFAKGIANVAQPATTITSPAPNSTLANAGGTITVSGTATGPTGSHIGSVELAVQMGGQTGTWLNATTGTWSTGAFNNAATLASPGKASSSWSFTFAVPAVGSSYQVFANAVASGKADRKGAQTAFTVGSSSSNPQVTVSASTVAPGATVSVSGGPFAGGELVDVSLQSGVLKKTTASSTGQIAGVVIAVPANAGFGLNTLTATGETSKKSGTTSVDITNVWTQSGYDALLTGYEPNDPVLGTTQQSTNSSFLAQAWAFDAGAAIDTSPAVVAGIAYVADAAGAISAVDTIGGSSLWTYVTPSTAPIVGAPAAGTLGDVVFGSDDGNLYRVAAANGSLIGTFGLDGVPTSPTLANGTIYVGTDNGTVYALNESTGAQVWSTPVGAAISEQPSVDTVAGLLFVGDDAGTISIINPTSGAVISKLTTGGAAVTSVPSVSGGLVLIGAADGYLRAFEEASSHKLAWKFNADSPVQALASTGTYVYLGAASGALVRLTEKTGGQLYRDVLQGGVVGIGYSAGIAFAETSKGHFYALKDYDYGGVKLDYVAGESLSSQPVVVDGTVYLGATSGSLIAFTNYGQAPSPDAIRHRFLAQVRAQSGVPRAWSNRTQSPNRDSMLARAFAPHGSRTFPLHVDRAEAPTGAAEFRRSNAGERTYVIGWSPVAVRARAYVARAGAALNLVTASAIDTTPYPRALDDAAIQRELARIIIADGWHAGSGARFIVLTAASPLSARDYCSYHSAFDLSGVLAAPVIYGVVPAGTTEECGAFNGQVARESRELFADPFVRAQ